MAIAPSPPRTNLRIGSCVAVLVLVSSARMALAGDAPLAPGAPLPEPATRPQAPAGSVRVLEWKDLLPADERDKATLVPPTPLHDYLLGESSPAASQPVSTTVNRELDGRRVRIPGFVVPLEIDAQGRVTELFLVPYFGACIHVPPPPPNQIVLVRLGAPLELGAMDAAYWVTGTLAVASSKTRLGASAYVLAAEKTEEYRY